MRFRFSIILLVMAAICFLLPFVNVRCSKEASAAMGQVADSTQTKGEIFFYYTGLQLALGQEPSYPAKKGEQKPETDKPKADSTQTDSTASVAEPIVTQNTADPFRAVQAEAMTPQEKADMTGEPQVQVDPGPKNPEASTAKPNIYALLALIFVILGVFTSAIPHKNGLLITAVLSTLAIVLLNLLKMNFGVYLQQYMAIEKQYMSYLEVEFTLYYWLTMGLCILAFVEMMIRLLTGYGEPEPVVVTAVYPAVDVEEFDPDNLDTDDDLMVEDDDQDIAEEEPEQEETDKAL